MTKILIKDIDLSRLDNGSHFTFVSDILKKAQAVTAVGEKAADYLAAFKAAVETEDEVLKLSAKSLITDAIAEADNSRDALYTGLKYAIRGFLRSLNAEHAAAAVVLNQLVTDYRINPQAALVQESGLLTNFLTDLTTKHKEEVEKLGLTHMVEDLNAANTRVVNLMQERTDERMNARKGETAAARKLTDEAYRQLVLMVNGLVYTDPQTDYNPFVKFVNTEILYFRQQVLGQKGSKPDGGGDTGGDGSGDTPGTGDGGGDTPGGTPDENPGGNPGGGTGGGDDGDDDFVG